MHQGELPCDTIVRIKYKLQIIYLFAISWEILLKNVPYPHPAQLLVQTPSASLSEYTDSIPEIALRQRDVIVLLSK